MFLKKLKRLKIKLIQTIPSVPAVNPTTKKKANSKRSLGKEFIIKLN